LLFPFQRGSLTTAGGFVKKKIVALCRSFPKSSSIGAEGFPQKREINLSSGSGPLYWITPSLFKDPREFTVEKTLLSQQVL